MAGFVRIPKINVVNATKEHTATLFFFHGSGSSGDDLKEWVDILSRGEFKFPHIKILYPTAPSQPYSLNYGMPSNVWFNRKELSVDAAEDVDSITRMCQHVVELIDKEVSNGIPYNRIMIGGFSMGGGLSMCTAYKFKPSLAGCFALSSFLNKTSSVYEYLKKNPGLKTPPLLQFHGTADELIPIRWAEETKNNLEKLGVNVKFTPLNNTEHELIKTEIESLRKWILDILPEN